MVAEQERRFGRTPVRSLLSFKTHPVRQLAAEWIRSGRGVEVVSEAELVAVRALGCPAPQLLINGVGKHMWMHRYAIPGARVHVDSLREADALLPLAAAQGWRVGLRCHVPEERDAREVRFGGQFGLSADEFVATHKRALAEGVHVEGVHFHLGQAARSASSYSQAMRHVVDLCRMNGVRPSYIDCGGGIDAGDDTERSFDDLVSASAWARDQLPTLAEIWVENGRYLTRGSAALIVRVMDIKVRDECRYLICDGGRTNHALDADNGPHRLLMRPNHSGPRVDDHCRTDMYDRRPARASQLAGGGGAERLDCLARRRRLSPAVGNAVLARSLRRGMGGCHRCADPGPGARNTRRLELSMDPANALTQLVHDGFRALALSEHFACVGGRAAVRQEAYRFRLYEHMATTASTAALAIDLRAFLADDDLRGKRLTAFVASFVAPVPPDEDAFEALLWTTLQQLHHGDDQPWAFDRQADPEDPAFSFSFAGTGLFVVGLHANSSRFSRRFAWSTLVFNPHAQFDRLRREGRYRRFRDVIRTRDVALQGTVNPMLQDFGEQSEARQYSGRAVRDDWKCPFHAEHQAEDGDKK
jgi:FPC/CPF motif-containing protein YcgG/diaminopimelate decarboxylase